MKYWAYTYGYDADFFDLEHIPQYLLTGNARNDFQQFFKFPIPGFMDSNSLKAYVGANEFNGYYWSSSPSSLRNKAALALVFSPPNVAVNGVVPLR